MTRGASFRALLAALPLTLLLGGCLQLLGYPPRGGEPMDTQAAAEPPPVPGGAPEAMSPPPPTDTAAGPMDGMWTSNDGVFVATFDRGNFTSRFTKTNEVLAQGTYTVSGDTVDLQWVSVATQQKRSASCKIASPQDVTCNQSGGGTFDLKRSA